MSGEGLLDEGAEGRQLPRRVPFLGHWVSDVEGRGTISGSCVTPCHKVDLVGGDRVGRRDGGDLSLFFSSLRFSSLVLLPFPLLL